MIIHNNFAEQIEELNKSEEQSSFYQISKYLEKGNEPDVNPPYRQLGKILI